ncbi:MAG: hypothetical protein QW775_03725 [Ignisphaera sp.]|uniref:Uncharacterized protein n=1 Tax=Ignisphaera aggregans TaxID=334771 RepID=A0A7C4JJZ0_9CREN
MQYKSIKLIEQQLVEVIERGLDKANILRSYGFSKEADEEIISNILTAIILIRAYCLYSYIDEERCIALEQTLLPLYATFVTVYKVGVDSRFLDQISALLSHGVQQSKAEDIAYEVGVA